MDQYLLAVVLTILSLITSEVTSLQCYQCLINPPPGHYYNTTKRLCVHFDHSDKFIVDCPYSTMCMKQDFHLDIQNGVRIKGELRDCAPQKHEYQDYKNGRWSPKMEILEPYREGCQNIDDKGERTTKNRYCYCRSDLCNSSPNTNHEGYTDVMGVIVVFNLMKYINSLRWEKISKVQFEVCWSGSEGPLSLGATVQRTAQPSDSNATKVIEMYRLL